jgi:hypothetical protein
VSLNWSLEGIENFRGVCYERLTEEEAKAQGTTLEELLNQTNFGGCNWYVPGNSPAGKLANAGTIERLNPVTLMFIWATTSVDLRGITEENHVEFWLRMKFHEKFHGCFLRTWDEETKGWKPRDIAYEEVKSHIGLHTNVSEKSWREWVNRVVDHARDGMLREAQLPNSRGTWQNRALSAVANDTVEQLDAWRRALLDHYCGGDELENEAYSHDYPFSCTAADNISESARTWKEIEDRLNIEEE